MKFSAVLVAVVSSVAVFVQAAPVPEPSVKAEGCYMNPNCQGSWKREPEAAPEPAPTVQAEGYWNPGYGAVWKKSE